MAKINEICEKTGIFCALEFLSEKLSSLCEYDIGILRGLNSEKDVENFLQPYKENFDRATSLIEYGEYEFYIYSNRMSEISPLPIPTVIGLSHDIEILSKYVSCSNDLLLELVNIANIRRESYMGFDIIPVTILLYETLHLNYLKILNIISDFMDKSNNKIISDSINNLIFQISNVKCVIQNEIYFIKLFNKFAYLNSRELVVNIILPLNRHQNPFKSSTTFQLNEELSFFLNEYNSIMIEQKKEMMNLAIKFTNACEINSKILEYIVYFLPYFNDPCFNCYDVSELWAAPFIFNEHILSHLSCFYSPMYFISPELFIFTSFICVLKISSQLKSILPNNSFDFLYRIFIHISHYLTQLNGTLQDSIYKPARSTFSFPSLLYLCFVVYAQAYLDTIELSAIELDKLTTTNLEKIIHALIEHGAFIWLRRLVFENRDRLNSSIVFMIHDFIVSFITIFSSSVSSWYRQLNDEKYSQNIVFIRNHLLLICDFYGFHAVHKQFGAQTPLSEYFKCIDFSRKLIVIPRNNSLSSIRDLALLNFVLKIFASTTKFFMLELACYAFYGLSNSETSAKLVGILFDTSNMQAILLNFSQTASNESTSYLNWSILLKIINDISIYKDELSLKLGNKIINRSLTFLVGQLIGNIFKNCPGFIVEICQQRNFDLAASCIKHLLSDENHHLKPSLWFLLKEAVVSGDVNSHVLSLLDSYDFSEEAVKIKESLSMSTDFIRHSRICIILLLSSKKDSQFPLLSFVEFVSNIIESYLNPKNIWPFKPCKVLKIYILFILSEIFTNLNLRQYPSDYIKWKLISRCLTIFITIINEFCCKIKNLKPPIVNISPIPLHPLTFPEILLAAGCDIASHMYQNNNTIKTLIDVVKQGISILDSVNPSVSIQNLVSKTLSRCFEFLITMIEHEALILNMDGLLPTSMIYTRLTDIIVNTRVSSDTKPVLYEFMKIFLSNNINPKTITNFTEIFCLCLKASGSQEILAHRLQNQSLDSQKIIHKFSSSWDTDTFIGVKSSKLTKKYANFIIKLFQYNHYEVAEIILFGARATDPDMNNPDMCLHYFSNHQHFCFPTIIRTLYKSELIYEGLESIKIHERLFCIISCSLSYFSHRKFLLPVLRSLFNYDFIFYVLNVLNNRLTDIRELINKENYTKVDYMLRLIGSVIHIAAIDLAESVSRGDKSRVEKLLSSLVCSSINDSSIVVQLAKYVLSIVNRELTYEFDDDPIFDGKTIRALTEQSLEHVYIFPREIMEIPLKIVNVSKFERLLYLHQRNETILLDPQITRDSTRVSILELIKNRNLIERISYSKYYLLDSINFCLSCMLLTKSNILRKLYNSDQELLDIIKHILDYTLANIATYNPEIINSHLNILNTIMCLNSIESYLSVSFKNTSVLCLPQNLLIILNHLVDYRSKRDFNAMITDDCKQNYYLSLIYIKITCDKMIKFWYLYDESKQEKGRKAPYKEVINILLSRLSSETLLTYLIDDCLSDHISLQVVSIETILILIRNDSNVADCPIIEYLFIIDFYSILIQILLKYAPKFTNIVMGLGNDSLNIIRCLELIMNCFLILLHKNGGLQIVYKVNFLNKLKDSNILEYSVTVLSNSIKSVTEKGVSTNEAFKRVYCPAIDLLCKAMSIPSTLQDEIIISVSNVFLKNIHSFKSIIEYATINENRGFSTKTTPFNRDSFSIFSTTLKFISELAVIRNRIVASNFDLSPYRSKLSSHLLEGVNDFFENFVLLLQKFSDLKYCSSTCQSYIKDLFMASPLQNDRDLENLDTEKIDLPPFSFKTVTTLQEISNILFFLVRYFQHYIVAYTGCQQPILTELIFLPEKFSRLSDPLKFLSELNLHFKYSSTINYNKPSIASLCNILDIFVAWQISVNNSLLLIKRCLNAIEYSSEISNLAVFRSKWSEFVLTLSKEKQQEFSTKRLNKLKNKYLNLSKFLTESIERVMLIITVHANYFEERFHSKVSEFRTTQMFKKINKLSEFLDIMSNKDNQSQIISEFVNFVKNYFNTDKIRTLVDLFDE
ncbi:hypothetical protein HZS_3416, partial [Henneguya salminicola]